MNVQISHQKSKLFFLFISLLVVACVPRTNKRITVSSSGGVNWPGGGGGGSSSVFSCEVYTPGGKTAYTTTNDASGNPIPVTVTFMVSVFRDGLLTNGFLTKHNGVDVQNMPITNATPAQVDVVLSAAGPFPQNFEAIEAGASVNLATCSTTVSLSIDDQSGGGGGGGGGTPGPVDILVGSGSTSVTEASLNTQLGVTWSAPAEASTCELFHNDSMIHSGGRNGFKTVTFATAGAHALRVTCDNGSEGLASLNIRQAPQITSLTVSPTEIDPAGQQITVSWTSTNAVAGCALYLPVTGYIGSLLPEGGSRTYAVQGVGDVIMSCADDAFPDRNLDEKLVTLTAAAGGGGGGGGGGNPPEISIAIDDSEVLYGGTTTIHVTAENFNEGHTCVLRRKVDTDPMTEWKTETIPASGSITKSYTSDAVLKDHLYRWDCGPSVQYLDSLVTRLLPPVRRDRVHVGETTMFRKKCPSCPSGNYWSSGGDTAGIRPTSPIMDNLVERLPLKIQNVVGTAYMRFYPKSFDRFNSIQSWLQYGANCLDQIALQFVDADGYVIELDGNRAADTGNLGLYSIRNFADSSNLINAPPNVRHVYAGTLDNTYFDNPGQDDRLTELMHGCSFDVVHRHPTSGNRPHAQHMLFVTSQDWNGNLGGLAGADAKCEAIAHANGHRTDRPWKAVLGEQGTAARDRISLWGDVVNTRLQRVASKNDFFQSGNNVWTNHVMWDEHGNEVPAYPQGVWTGSKQDGSASDDCYKWTSGGGGLGRIGLARDYTLYTRLDYIPIACSVKHRLYCISQ